MRRGRKRVKLINDVKRRGLRKRPDTDQLETTGLPAGKHLVKMIIIIIQYTKVSYRVDYIHKFIMELFHWKQFQWVSCT